MTELLAPVGAEESLVAAVQNGADAVYLSGGSFGARAFAKNFDNEQLLEAIDYAHIRGVNVYVTVNTLIKDSEFEAVKDYVDFLYLNQVDAIIVQDLGLADYIRTTYPDLDLHASTQMSAHSLEDVKFLKEFGFNRVVVAREMTIEEIKEIKEKVDIEIEVFVHGALCVSYSGQCLMSSMIGGRSGNRGRCAQPCRQRYTILEETSYTISPRDLNTVNQVDELIKAGADSLKIEGRMKGPEYAATVVKSYRDAINHIKNDLNLNKIFNRSYTEGYLFEKNIIASDTPGNRGERVGTVKGYDFANEKLSLVLEMELHKGDEIQIRREDSSIGARTDVFYQHDGRRVKTYDYNGGITVDFKYKAFPGEVVYRTYDNEVMSGAKQSYHKEVRKSKIDMVLLCRLEEVILKATDGQHEVVFTSDVKPEKAISFPLDYDRVKKQLAKLGSTPYVLDHLDVFLDDGLSIPMKVLNDLRRQCTDAINELRTEKYDRVISESTMPSDLVEENQTELTIAVRNIDQYNAVKDLGLDVYCMAGEGIKRLPRISHKNNYQQTDEIVLAGNYGQIGAYKNAYVDYSLNVFNQQTINTYHTLGKKRVTLSYEMSKDMLSEVKPNKNQDLECIIYGYAPVMILAYCPITKNPTHCESCHEPCQNHMALQDRFDEDYPLIRNGNRLEVLNSKRLNLIYKLDELVRMNIKYLRLDFTIESPEEVLEITEAYIKTLNGHRLKLEFEDETEGHYFKGVE